MEDIDAHDYWINRHKKENGLAAVGLKSSSAKGNYYQYKIVLEQYGNLLQKLDLLPSAKVLDAGCGIGSFIDFFLQKKYSVTVADISPDAIDRIKNKYGDSIKAVCTGLDKLDLSERFEVVHSFDVLYHILDDREWEKTLENFSKLSSKYIILHQRFLSRKPVILSKHIKFRPYTTVCDILANLGFKEIATIPTHFLALRIFTYRLGRYFPKLFYTADKYILNYCVKNNWLSWGSYHIKVFEKII